MAKASVTTEKRVYISQSDFPRFTLQQALKLPQALWDEFAGKDAPPHNVAIALGMSPTSGTWRNLCGTAVAYGLVEGGYNATKMALTPGLVDCYRLPQAGCGATLSLHGYI